MINQILDRIRRLEEYNLEKISNTSVAIFGAGTLGNMLSLELAASGFANLTIVDNQCVAIENVGRQVLFTLEDVGKLKVEVAREKLLQFFPYMNIEAVNMEIPYLAGAPNDLEQRMRAIEGIVKKSDILALCLDNLDTRRTLTVLGLGQNKVIVNGGIWKYEGNVEVIRKNSCCTFCHALPPWLMENKGEGKVISGCSVSSIPAICITASMMAEMILKIVHEGKIGNAIDLVKINLQSMKVYMQQMPKDENCYVCSYSGALGKYKEGDLSWFLQI